MASKYFIGGATAIAQEDRFTPGGTIETGDKFILTLTGEDGATATITAVATGTTVAQVCADLLTAWNASTTTFKSGITASNQTTYFKLLGTAGTPFYCSASTTETDDSPADSQTFSRTATTANAGPNDWGTGANWSDFAVPVNSDSIVLDGRMTASILYGLNQSGVTLTSFKHYRGAKAVGTVYAALRIGVTTGDSNLPVEDGSSPAATFFNVNVGTVQTTWSNWGSASQGSSGLEPVMFDGTHASNVLNVYGGIVGVGTLTPGDTTTVATLNVIGGGAKAVISSGTTLTTLNVEEGAKAVVRCAATTINVKNQSCTLTTEGAGAITTLNCNGTATLNSTGTVTNLHIEDSGNVNTRATNNARTVTNGFVYGNGLLTTDLNTTYTNGVDCLRGAKSNQVDFGDNVTVTPSAT